MLLLDTLSFSSELEACMYMLCSHECVRHNSIMRMNHLNSVYHDMNIVLSSQLLFSRELFKQLLRAPDTYTLVFRTPIHVNQHVTVYHMFCYLVIV